MKLLQIFGWVAFSMTAVFSTATAGTLTIMHHFRDGSVANDADEVGGVIQATDGNFYGTSYWGGTANKGTIFRLTPSGTVSIAHNFGDGSVVNDGYLPYSGLSSPSG